MYEAISSKNKFPIDVENEKDKNGLRRFDLEYVDIGNPEEFIALDEIPSDPVDFCPFCGENISTCIPVREEAYKWQKRDYICGSFRRWFNVDENGNYANAPTPMFKFDPTNGQFYMHYRKGFGEGLIPIEYCIYCEEPLSQMVKKYGLPDVIAAHLDPSEWQGKYKICTKKKTLTENDQLPDELST
jgi:hypothetical protein